MEESELTDYLNSWMAETGFKRLLMQKSTNVIDVAHLQNSAGEHQSAILCENGLVLLFPPATQ